MTAGQNWKKRAVLEVRDVVVTVANNGTAHVAIAGSILTEDCSVIVRIYQTMEHLWRFPCLGVPGPCHHPPQCNNVSDEPTCRNMSCEWKGGCTGPEACKDKLNANERTRHCRAAPPGNCTRSAPVAEPQNYMAHVMRGYDADSGLPLFTTWILAGIFTKLEDRRRHL